MRLFEKGPGRTGKIEDGEFLNLKKSKQFEFIEHPHGVIDKLYQSMV
jgi:hypothetical protein